MKIDYVTGNRHKFAEAQHILKGWELQNIALDLLEIQGTAEEIIQAKAREALRLLQAPLIVEDISLYCQALGGLPGPYAKEFLKKLSAGGLATLIHHYQDHTARAVCLAAFIKPGIDPVVFSGEIQGTIVSPRHHPHQEAHGFNPIFQPDGFTKTFDEMTVQEHSAISMRYRALTKLKHYLEQHPI